MEIIDCYLGSVPDSAPDFDLMGPDGRNPVRYRANSHRSLKSNESHDSRSNQGPELEIEDDLIGRLSLDNQSSDDVMLPTVSFRGMYFHVIFFVFEGWCFCEKIYLPKAL